MLLSDEKCVDDEVILCVLAQWLVILINAGCVLFLGINFGSNRFSEKRDLVKKYFRLCKMKLCCCFVEKQRDESAMQRRESYVEMSVVMHLMIIMLQVALMMSIVLVVGMSTISCEEPLFSWSDICRSINEDNLIIKYWKLFKLELYCCFVDKQSDKSAMQHRE